MALEAKLVQKLSQNLMMTPQLQQAIKLLQLGRLEYVDAIQRELLENPVLEEARETEEDAGRRAAQEANPGNYSGDSGGSAGDSGEEKGFDEGSFQPEAAQPEMSKDTSPFAIEEYLEYYSDSHGAATPKGLVNYDDLPSLEATATRDESLQEHLIEQLRHVDICTEEKLILAHMIGNLDRDGYLCSTNEELAAECECNIDDIPSALQVLQEMDPPGVGARDLRECLLLQLEHAGLRESLAWRIVDKHLAKLEKRRYEQIAKEESTAADEVYKAFQHIKNLEPRPGRPFADDSARYIVPDIYVQKDGEGYVITMNEDGLPKLRLSSYYLDLLRNNDSPVSGQRSYLNERLKAATWLIKSMHQRQQTIYRVTESIVKFQKEFLEYGIPKLKPLVLKDVADDIGMHESTVSRVTTNKYVHTPQGVFELKFFFSNGIKTADGDMSSSSVKERIRALISAEEPVNPISDQKIVEILKAEKIDIARRTVAKYRENMGIASSSQRKRPF